MGLCVPARALLHCWVRQQQPLASGNPDKVIDEVMQFLLKNTAVALDELFSAISNQKGLYGWRRSAIGSSRTRPIVGMSVRSKFTISHGLSGHR